MATPPAVRRTACHTALINLLTFGSGGWFYAGYWGMGLVYGALMFGAFVSIFCGVLPVYFLLLWVFSAPGSYLYVRCAAGEQPLWAPVARGERRGRRRWRAVRPLLRRWLQVGCRAYAQVRHQLRGRTTALRRAVQRRVQTPEAHRVSRLRATQRPGPHGYLCPPHVLGDGRSADPYTLGNLAVTETTGPFET